MNAPSFWHQRSVLGYVLAPLSLLYWWGACLRTAKYQPEILPVPVICVGNNTVGGSGKTPTVIRICQLLQKAGKNPHVISRGYKGSHSGVQQVDPSHHTAADVGDEPLLIAEHAPCWVATKRLDAALAAIAAGADCVVMDDGMQNPTIKKRATIMVVDGGYGFGNRQMLPAGPCREPIALSLTKADMLLVMGAPTHADVASITALHNHVFQAHIVATTDDDAASHTPQWQGMQCLAFAGIGRPAKFYDTLRQLGATLADTASFPDHHAYSEAELQQLKSAAQAANATLITTQKDWLRLPENWCAHIAYLPVQAKLADEEGFTQRLLTLMDSPAP